MGCGDPNWQVLYNGTAEDCKLTVREACMFSRKFIGDKIMFFERCYICVLYQLCHVLRFNVRPGLTQYVSISHAYGYIHLLLINLESIIDSLCSSVSPSYYPGRRIWYGLRIHYYGIPTVAKLIQNLHSSIIMLNIRTNT